MRVVALAVGLAAAMVGAAPATDDSAPRPNIVVIVSDDMGWGQPGFNGGTEVATPNMDRIANEGVKLTQFYVQPVCAASRASLFTGRYAWKTGLADNPDSRKEDGLLLDERTLPAALQGADYATWLVGKWHLGHWSSERLPLQRGFDHHYGFYNGFLDAYELVRPWRYWHEILDWHRNERPVVESGYSTFLLADEASQLIGRHDGSRPFFLFVGFNAPHGPYMAPQEYVQQVPDLPYSDGEVRRQRAMVRALDDAIGQVLSALDRRGVLDSTLVLFLNDNGGTEEAGGNRPWRGLKRSYLEGGIRVPAVMRWPEEISAGSESNALLHVVDLFPALAGLAGANTSAGLPLDGVDVWETIVSGAENPRAEVVYSPDVIRVGDWKLLEEDGAFVKGVDSSPLQLYNIADDPYETTNLASSQTAKVAELRERLAHHRPFARGPEPGEFIPGLRSPSAAAPADRAVMFGEEENTQFGAAVREAMSQRELGNLGPSLLRLEASGIQVKLVFDEPLDSDSVPAASAFRVVVNPGFAPAEVTHVKVSGSDVLLTLAEAPGTGTTAGLTYEVPDTGAVRSEDELTAAGLTWATATVAATSPSVDATLASLALSGIDIGTFAAATTEYAANVPHAIASTTVTATANQTGATVSISPGATVSLAEGANAITVTVTAADGTTTETYTVTVTRAPPPVVSIAAPPSPATEGAAVAFEVALDRATVDPLTVSVRVSETGSVLAGIATGSVTIPGGSVSATLSVPTEGDTVVEADSTVTASVTVGTGYALGTASSASVTVIDDDEATFAVSTAPEAINEGESATLTVGISNEVTFSGDQAIDLTVSGTASAADYSLTPTALTLAAGSVSVTATLAATADQVDEEAETLTVTASHGGSTIGSATVAINSVSRAGAAATPPRPNILVVVTDDLGWGQPGFNGGTEVGTPNLDRIANEGVRLTQFYVSPGCSPTRSALLTGRHYWKTGGVEESATRGLDVGVLLDERLMAEALRDAGYETWAIGKWHLGQWHLRHLPLQRGFDHHYGMYSGTIGYGAHHHLGALDWHRNGRPVVEKGYSTFLMAEEAVQLIGRHDGTDPFFLYLAFNAAHLPDSAPEEYTERYADTAEPKQRAQVKALDDALGWVLDALESKGMLDDTLFVYVNDNGGTARAGGNAPYRGLKGDFHEGGIRVPAAMRWPGHIPPASESDALLHAVDVFPTLAGLAGASTTGGLPLDGLDAWQAIAAGTVSPRQELAHSRKVIRVGDWKLLEPDGVSYAGRSSSRRQLYNIAEDPYEETNLAGSEPAKVAELRARLAHHRASARDPAPAEDIPAGVLVYGFDENAAYGGAVERAVTENKAGNPGPALLGLEVIGDVATLNYSEELDTASVPDTDRFRAVAVPGYAVVDIASVEVVGTEVRLTMARTLAPGEMLGLTYEVPDDSAIRDLDRLDAVGTTWVTAEAEDEPLTGQFQDATLASLELTGGYGNAVPLEPGFAAATTSYTATVGHSVARIALSASARSRDATLAYVGGGGAAIGDDDPGTDALDTSLVVGENMIVVLVTAGDGTTTQTYTVAVTRASEVITATNRGPEFAEPSATRSVAETVGSETEGTAADIGGPIVATDADEDSLEYRVEGVHANLFAIDVVTGQLSTKTGTGYDHEHANRLTVTVVASDVHGATASITVTIEVTDVSEVPLAPAAPTVRGASATATGLVVSWRAPDNTGRPPVEGYDLQYREETETSWMDGPQDVAGTAAGIVGLLADTLYAVRVRAGNTDGEGAWSGINTGRTNAIAHSADIDADRENRQPRGLWGDGDRVWVADYFDSKLYAYSLTDGSRAMSRDIATDAGTDDGAKLPAGVWGNGETVWVADNDADWVYAYRLRDGARDAARDLALGSSDLRPSGLWGDGETLWVLDKDGRMVYAYAMSDHARDPGKDFPLSAGTFNWGLWSDGEVFWTVDFTDKTAYAYRNGSRLPSADIALDRNWAPSGLWSDGVTVWVSEYVIGGLRAYALPWGSTNDSLVLLRVSGADLGPFSPSTTAYSATMPDGTATATLTATPAAGARLVIDPPDADAAAVGHQVALAEGANTVTVTVTAADRATTGTYRVTLRLTSATGTAVTDGGATVDELSADATLASLALSGIDIGTFAADTTRYTAAVGNDMASTQVTATANDAGASVTIADGGSRNVSLDEGANAIMVTVTAEDGVTTKTYTVTVTREKVALRAWFSSQPTAHDGSSTFTVRLNFSEDITTSYKVLRDDALSASGGTISKVKRVNGRNDLWNVHVQPSGDTAVTLTLVPPTDDCAAVGAICTSDGRALSNTQSVTVDGPAEDAMLSALTLTGIDIGTFAPDMTSYSASVGYSVASTQVTVSANNAGASVTIADGDGSTDGTSRDVSLDEGSNTITVTVTAEDGVTTETYSVTVTREAVSTDATLSALALTGIDIGTFAAGTTSYSASVSNAFTSTQVTATANNAHASVTITDDDGSTDGTSRNVSLDEGSNTITITVTAEDGATTKTYTVTVTREEPALTAQFESVPDRHDGSSPFDLTVRFSEELAKGAAGKVSSALAVSRATLGRVRRVGDTRDLFTFSLTPSDGGAVNVRLRASSDCSRSDAVCTADGRALSNTLSVTVNGPAAVGANVIGPIVTLQWGRPRDAFGSPSGSDYGVRVNGEARAVVSAALSGSTARLTLESPVTAGDRVTVAYLGSAMHPLAEATGRVRSQPWDGLMAENLTGIEPLGARATIVDWRPSHPLAAVADDAVRLDASGLGLTGVWGLERLAALERLDLSGNAVSDLWPLAGLYNLERLNLTGTAVTDVQALTGLPSLRDLDLSGNQITDLWPLAGLYNLERLNLTGTAVTDVQALAGLPSLRDLDLSGNQVTDLWPLAGLYNLERLNLTGTAVTDVQALAGLPSLRDLDLSGNQITDLWPLAGLYNLERLNLTGTAVTDVQALAGLPSLKVLLLEGNDVSDAWPLAGFGKLENLDLGGNRIGDVTALQDLPRLRRLDLSGNPAADISPLGDIGSLVWLALPGNRAGASEETLGRLTGLGWVWSGSVGTERNDVSIDRGMR